MGIALTRLDEMRESAVAMATPEQPLAMEPQVYCIGNSALAEDIAGRLRLEDVVQFAAENNERNPDDLRSMGIVLEDVRSPAIQGGTLPTAVGHEGRVHYPFIWLPVHRRSPQWWFEFRLRHELRHPFQAAATTELYRQPTAMSLLRKVGVLATAAEICGYAKLLTMHAAPAPAEAAGGIVGGSILGTLSIIAAANPSYLAWYFSRNEWDANLFALRTKTFKSISKN